MIDFRGLRRTISFGAASAVSMAALLTSLALVRDTTGHDWYAASKLVLTEAMLAVGFDASKPTEYRAADGSIRRVTRLRFAYTVEAWRARSHILSTIEDNGVLGASAGFTGAVLLRVLSSAARRGRRGRAPAAMAQPAYRDRRFAGRDDPGFAQILSRHADGGARVGLLVAPVEVDRMAGAFKRAGLAGLPPAATPGESATKGTSPQRLPHPQSAGRETDTESAKPAESANPEPGSARNSPGQSTESSHEHGTGRDGETAAQERQGHPGPDDDGDWV